MLLVKIFNRIRDIVGKKMLEFIHGLKKSRCMFDRKRICEQNCRAFYSDIKEDENPFRIIKLPSGICNQEGKEILTPCLRLASQSVLGHHLDIFNKKVVREILRGISRENKEDLIREIVRQVFQEMAEKMQ